jgi:hypothetical protein
LINTELVAAVDRMKRNIISSNNRDMVSVAMKDVNIPEYQSDLKLVFERIIMNNRGAEVKNQISKLARELERIQTKCETQEEL